VRCRAPNRFSGQILRTQYSGHTLRALSEELACSIRTYLNYCVCEIIRFRLGLSRGQWWRRFDVSLIMSARTLDITGLYLSERGRLSRLIRRIVRNQTVVEDLVHDAFVNLIDKGQPARQHSAYLTRIAQNLAIDHQRRQRFEPVPLEDAELFAMADATPSPETVLIDREALALTVEILAGLPPRMRQAFELHRLGDMTLAAIARKLNISTAHAGRLVMQGYGAVRSGLKDAGSRTTNSAQS